MLPGFCPARFGVPFAVWCSAAVTHLKLLDRAVSGARFLTGGVFECDIDHRRSVAILCLLYKTRCHPMYPLNPNINLIHVLGVSLENYFSPVWHAWHLLP